MMRFRCVLAWRRSFALEPRRSPVPHDLDFDTRRLVPYQSYRAVPRISRHALAAVLAILGVACTAPDDLGGPWRATFQLSADSVRVAPQHSVTLTATVVDDAGPVGGGIIWRSLDSAVFRLDTVTTAPHRATGRGGRPGTTQLHVTSPAGLRIVPVTVGAP